MNYIFKTYSLAIALLLTGLSTASAQRNFRFEIDGEKYSIEESKYNDLFGITFSKLVERGVAKEDSFPIWAETFNAFKVFSVKGYHVYTTYGDRVASSQYQGDMPLYYLGWEKPGKLSKANPNKSGSIPARMSFINHYLSREVIRYLTHKDIVN